MKLSTYPGSTTSNSLSSRAIGQRSEDIAERYLRDIGYRILRRNIFTRWGEIDILAVYQDEFVCVEVKSRQKRGYLPEQLLTREKYQHLVRSILSLSWLHNRAVRIDLITVVKQQVVHHYRNVQPHHLSTAQEMAYVGAQGNYIQTKFGHHFISGP